MIHPLFITMAKRPGLFLEHADAYTDLAVAELACWKSRLKHRATLMLAAVLLSILALGLGGVACLLAAALPVQAMHDGDTHCAEDILDFFAFEYLVVHRLNDV